MKSLLMMLLTLILVGCALSSDANYMIDTGKKPPAFFRIVDLDTMNNYVFDTRRFSFRLPQGKPIDFRDGKIWRGGSSRDGNSVGFFNGPYHISISTDYYPQKLRAYQKAILNEDLNYFKEFFKRSKFEKLYITHLGKESYPCLVKEFIHFNGGIKELIAVYGCYKFNPAKTKFQSVEISLTYTKPLDPKLAKLYTYEDLKHRAKRMLDSLYIKSWW